MTALVQWAVTPRVERRVRAEQRNEEHMLELTTLVRQDIAAAAQRARSASWILATTDQRTGSDGPRAPRWSPNTWLAGCLSSAWPNLGVRQMGTTTFRLQRSVATVAPLAPAAPVVTASPKPAEDPPPLSGTAEVSSTPDPIAVVLAFVILGIAWWAATNVIHDPEYDPAAAVGAPVGGADDIRRVLRGGLVHREADRALDAVLWSGQEGRP